MLGVSGKLLRVAGPGARGWAGLGRGPVSSWMVRRVDGALQVGRRAGGVLRVLTGRYPLGGLPLHLGPVFLDIVLTSCSGFWDDLGRVASGWALGGSSRWAWGVSRGDGRRGLVGFGAVGGVLEGGGLTLWYGLGFNLGFHRA